MAVVHMLTMFNLCIKKILSVRSGMFGPEHAFEYGRAMLKKNIVLWVHTY